MKAIINSKIVLKNKILKGHSVVFEKLIHDIMPDDELNINEIDECIDADGYYLLPGLIDIHIHGCGGSDVMDATKDSLMNISDTIVGFGVTRFLPTTMTMSKRDIHNALDNIKNNKDKCNGARVVGVHLEGPFISREYKGAQNEQFIMKPDIELVKQYEDIIKLVTVAPENDNNHEFIKHLRDKGINSSIGHSAASYDEAMSAINDGANHITHFFNAMSGIHHRTPGVALAGLMSDTYTELICDNQHINPCMYSFILKNKGIDKIVLITDCISAGCMKPGRYSLGGQPVNVDGVSARLDNGTLAGSILTLNKAIYNFLKATDIKLYDAVKLASLNPAKSIGIDDRYGSIECGKTADFAIADDKLNIKKTIIDGESFEI